MSLRFFAPLFLVVSLMTGSTVNADEASLRKAIGAKFPNATVDSIAKVPGLGLYELVIDGSVYYADEAFNYLVDGNIIELKSMSNLTAARKRELEDAELKKVAVAFDDLPLSKAFRKVFGDGSRRLAYFADPNCGYCKKFDRETLPNLTNATVYVFLYPIITAQSVPTSKAIWCSADRARAWDDYVIKGVAPKAAPDCDNPVDDILAFGYGKRIRGTPTLFFADGSRISGGPSLEDLEQLIDKAEAKRKANGG